MNNQFYPKEFHKSLSASEKFVNESIAFLRNWNEYIRYFDAEIPMFNLLTSIPNLPFQLKEYIFLGNRFGESGGNVNNTLYYIIDNLESISVNMPEDFKEFHKEIVRIWLLLENVYKELKQVLNYDLSTNFDLTEKNKRIKERRENEDYFRGEEGYDPYHPECYD
jgi:hypothetical protein